MAQITGNLKDLYKEPGKTVVTAHRGFSGKYPENTLYSFEEAVKLGVDIVEFDVRETSDGEIVILHDETLDRTTDGEGPVLEYSLADIKKLEASYWTGPHDSGSRASAPIIPGTRIPTIEEALKLLAGRVFMNIQVYAYSPDAHKKLINLYREYNLQTQAFFMVDTFQTAQKFRGLLPEVELCVGENRDMPEKHHDFGLNFIQPGKGVVDRNYVSRVEKLGLCANVFYSNTAEDNRKYLATNIKGILTDNPDILLNSIAEF